METPEQPAAAPERAEGDVKEMEGKQISQKSYGGKVSKRSRGDAVQAERKRISEINRLGEGVPAELVRKAVDEGWTQEKAAMEFIGSIRSNRAAPVAPAAIHVRSSDDVTPEVLGTALAIRSQGGEAVFKARGQYRQGEGGDYVLRRFGSSKEQESKRDQLVSRAEEYAHMSLADICREACRLDGKTLSLRTSHAEVFRTAVSGSSLASIFTTNFNASFMSGYIDYAHRLKSENFEPYFERKKRLMPKVRLSK